MAVSRCARHYARRPLAGHRRPVAVMNLRIHVVRTPSIPGFMALARAPDGLVEPPPGHRLRGRRGSARVRRLAGAMRY